MGESGWDTRNWKKNKSRGLKCTFLDLWGNGTIGKCHNHDARPRDPSHDYEEGEKTPWTSRNIKREAQQKAFVSRQLTWLFSNESWWIGLNWINHWGCWSLLSKNSIQMFSGSLGNGVGKISKMLPWNILSLARRERGGVKDPLPTKPHQIPNCKQFAFIKMADSLSRKGLPLQQPKA